MLEEIYVNGIVSMRLWYWTSAYAVGIMMADDTFGMNCFRKVKQERMYRI